MAFQVNSFSFGSLLTSAKMTALQDSVVHVMSNFALDHHYDNATVQGSHDANLVVNVEHAQTITGSKVYQEDIHCRKAIEVRSYVSIGSGTSNAHIKLHSSISGAEGNYIGYDSAEDTDALFLATNQLRSGVQDNAAEGSWSVGIGEAGEFRINFKPPGGSFNKIISATTTGVVSAYHIPNAGRSFGGIRTMGDVVVSVTGGWEALTGELKGALHCENFTIDAGILSTQSLDNPLMLFARDTVTINGTLKSGGMAGVGIAAAGAAGGHGIIGGSGGGGQGGGDGGATFLNSGGAAGANGTNCSTFFRNLLHSFVNITSYDNVNQFGGQGGGGLGVGDDGEGGFGGGLIYIEAETIVIGAGGKLNAGGGSGLNTSNADGGGGGGGIIYLRAKTFNISGTLDVNGGVGGDGSAGAGGDGLIILETVR